VSPVKGVERHCRACHLKRARRKVVDIGDPDIRTERKAQTGATGAKEELILRWQARIATRDVQMPM